MIFTPCYRECSDKKKNIYTEKTFFNKKQKKGQCRFLQVYLVKAPRICTVPNVINAIKRIFGRKKNNEVIRERDMLFSSSFLLLVNTVTISQML